MPPKCLVCSEPVTYKVAPKLKLYCSKECAKRAKWIKASSSVEQTMGRLLKNAKYRAEYKSIPFELDLNILMNLWIKQDGRCALTKFPFELGPSAVPNNPKRNAPSLDRIVPELGYIKENVRIITYQANCAKSGYTDKDLMEMCKAIIKGQAA